VACFLRLTLKVEEAFVNDFDVTFFPILLSLWLLFSVTIFGMSLDHIKYL
jgi:hypothetical protein